QCATLYRTVAYLACGNPGATSADQAQDNTWQMFAPVSGNEGDDVCAWNEEQRDYSRALHYWKVVPSPQKTTGELLADANGNCDAWVHLFRDTLLVNGVASYRVIVFPWNGIPEHADEYRLVVKEVDWDEQDPEFPDEPIWKYGEGNIDKSPAGLPGQNVETPAEKIFWWHWIDEWIYLVEVNGEQEERSEYYDPSYGVTYNGEADFTAKAIAGWGKLKDGDMHFAKISSPRPPEEKVQFERQP
ncbi:MAG: hypothetical protein ACOC7S_02995, partial [Planctomycetota bacterium]